MFSDAPFMAFLNRFHHLCWYGFDEVQQTSTWQLNTRQMYFQETLRKQYFIKTRNSLFSIAIPERLFEIYNMRSIKWNVIKLSQCYSYNKYSDRWIGICLFVARFLVQAGNFHALLNLTYFFCQFYHLNLNHK